MTLSLRLVRGRQGELERRKQQGEAGRAKREAENKNVYHDPSRRPKSPGKPKQFIIALPTTSVGKQQSV